MDKKISVALEQFSKKCFAIVKGDITNNTFEIIKGRFAKSLDKENALCYEDGLSGLWSSYLLNGKVYHEDLADCMQYVNLEFISDFMRKYHGKEKFEIDFRYRHHKTFKPVHLEVIAAEDYTDELQTIYTFIMSAGNKLREDYVRFDDLLRGLSENYGAIYYVDFDKDIIRPFRMNETIEKSFGDFFRSMPTYEAAMDGYISKIVSPKDKKMMYEITRYDFLKKQLANQLAYSHEYRLERNGREYVFRMKIANMEGIGPLHKAVMGFADVSMEKVYEYEITSLGKKIVIVANDSSERKLLSDIVSEQYEVIAVENGQAALDYLSKSYEDVALVITDFDLPGMNGAELIQKMQSVRQYVDISVIVTLDAIPLDREHKKQVELECLKLGVMDFILKPYIAEIVLNRIKRMIRLRESTMMLNTLERDSLTGLLSKEFFFVKATEHITQHPDQHYVMWVSDVIGLKLVNEKYGIKIGDAVLKTLANGQDNFQGFIFGGRIEGDKLAALIHEENFASCLEKLKCHTTGLKFPVPGIVVKHGFYHIHPNSTLPVQGMYDRALLALQKIKDEYDVIVAEYDDALRKDLMMHRQIEEDAEKALQEHQFEVYYQPKHNLHLGRTTGAEALIRWIHPELGFMNPGVFISQFEKNGFIRKLDLYVWEEVCKMLKTWKEEKKRLIPISVNASRRDFDDDVFAQKVIDIVDRYELDHSYFHIEITESAYSDNPEKIINTVNFFHANGFIVELDDFGSGYSSMTALSDLNLDIMKLDMSIIQNDNPDSDKNILEYSIHLAKMMKLQTVAEGVETKKQVERVTSLGGDYIQGYYYSKPLPRQQFENYLENETLNYIKHVTYENVLNEAKISAEKVDLNKIKESLSVEFNIRSAGEETFYIRFSPDKIDVQPYEYYDHDFRICADADTILSMLSGKLELKDAMQNERAYVSGNANKLQLLKSYMELIKIHV